MAKTVVKGKAKKSVGEVCGPCGVADTYRPRLYLELQDKDVAQVKGLTVGEKVQIVVEGTVKGLSQNERQYDDEKKKTGTIDLENYSVTVLADEDNEFVALAVEEDA